MAKRRLFKPDARIVQAPPRPLPVRVGLALLVTALCAACLWAVSVVDSNSRAVGWNQPRTEFAAALTGTTLRVTAFGEQFALPLSGAQAAARRVTQAASRYWNAAQRAQPGACQLAAQAGVRQAAAAWPRVARAFAHVWQAARDEWSSLFATG